MPIGTYTPLSGLTNADDGTLAASIVDPHGDHLADAKAKLRADPLGFVRKSFVGIFTFWYELTSFTNSLLAFVLAAVAWVLAVIGWRRARRGSRATAL